MIEIRKHDGGAILELAFARPPVNALNRDMLAALRQAVAQAAEGGAGALVLSGSRGVFSAGIDLAALLVVDSDGIAALWQELWQCLRDFAACPLPLVAAITGHAPAGGAVLALCCDERVMAAGRYEIGLNEVAIGLPVPAAVVGLFTRVIGARPAERLLLRGRMLSPAAALAAGLVDELADDDAVVERALARCRELLALPQQAYLATRDTVRADLRALFAEEDPELSRQMTEAVGSEETRRVLTALAARLAGDR